MDSAIATLVTGSATAAVTIGGWLAVHRFTREREVEGRSAAAARADKTRRLEILLRHHERQIEEFYGPIYSLIQLIWSVWLVKHEMLEKLSPQDNEEAVERVSERIGQFLGDNYFGPIHEEIRSILKTKLHLIEGAEMPDSFYDYLGHAVMENVQSRLWKDAGISTRSVRGRRWSERFPDDIKAGLDRTMASYREIIGQLEDRSSDRGPPDSRTRVAPSGGLAPS